MTGFGIPIAEATERYDEALDVLRKAWTSEGRFSHHGKHWHFDNVVVEPRPLQQPHPPFWMGAGSFESIRRAARDGFNLLLDQIGSVDLTIERVAAYRAEWERCGHAWHAAQVGVTRGLHIVTGEEERTRAYELRKQVLARDRGFGARPRRRALSQSVELRRHRHGRRGRCSDRHAG